MKTTLKHLKTGTQFTFGRVKWTVLEHGADGGTLAIVSEIVFEKAFDEGNHNDWRKSTLRNWLNDASGNGFIGQLMNNITATSGAALGMFKEIISDLTADNGMKDYGTATDYVALVTCEQFRKWRDIIPPAINSYWTLTPWTCDPSYSCYVRYVSTSGALNSSYAYDGGRGVRPLCNFCSDIWVSTDDETEDDTYEKAKIHFDDYLKELSEAELKTIEEFSFMVRNTAKILSKDKGGTSEDNDE